MLRAFVLFRRAVVNVLSDTVSALISDSQHSWHCGKSSFIAAYRRRGQGIPQVARPRFNVAYRPAPRHKKIRYVQASIPLLRFNGQPTKVFNVHVDTLAD